jgi:hypothetical protein
MVNRMPLRQPDVPVADPDRLWAESGAMWLTGHPDGLPLLAPSSLVRAMTTWAAGVAELSDVVVDGPSLLGERAALAGLSRHGPTSCGGAARLLPASDGWIAVSLARTDDVTALPAWLGCPASVETMPAAIASRSVDELIERSALLGLPAAGLGEAAGLPAVRASLFPGESQPVSPFEDLTVIDLSSLWAGPLCGQLLTDCGARVIKVESERRPDGARNGPPAFFDLLHAGQESIALDLTSQPGRRMLVRLLQGADIVIEASRPRALQQLGVDVRALLAGSGPRIWVSITGFGRNGAGVNRVAFGDDASVGGGLVVWDGDGPCFCADAIADPASGLLAANAVLSALADGGRWLFDVALAGVAAELAGRYARTPFAGRDGKGMAAARPRARPHRGTAPPLGRDTNAVLRERCC